MNLTPELTAVFGGLDFDPEALHTKYLAERDKRLREDANEQYIEVKGDFSHYVDDPYVEPGFTREPVFDEVDFLVIGGGFGGLLMSARLREAGFKKIRLVDKAGDVGGTWYWNRYPGAMCDVESYCYLPLLEELGYMPKHKYSFAPEILEHSQRIARHYDLYKDALFQTSITELRWDEKAARWIVSRGLRDRRSGSPPLRWRRSTCIVMAPSGLRRSCATNPST
jgi:cyclohexanone monooxygenase